MRRKLVLQLFLFVFLLGCKEPSPTQTEIAEPHCDCPSVDALVVLINQVPSMSSGNSLSARDSAVALAIASVFSSVDSDLALRAIKQWQVQSYARQLVNPYQPSQGPSTPAAGLVVDDWRKAYLLVHLMYKPVKGYDGRGHVYPWPIAINDGVVEPVAVISGKPGRWDVLGHVDDRPQESRPRSALNRELERALRKSMNDQEYRLFNYGLRNIGDDWGELTRGMTMNNDDRL